MQKSSINKVIIVGYLGQNPEARFTPQGTAVTNISVATKESWKNQNGEVQERTEWHRIDMYGKMAETASQYLTKGQLVYVEGRLKTDEWDDKETGAKRRATKVQCDNFTMLGRKGDSNNQNFNPTNQVSSSPDTNVNNPMDDDDLPF
jgi:single-strand DNA-binding protein